MSGFSDLTHADIERILALVDRLHDIEVRLELDGMKLHVRKFSDPSLLAAAGQQTFVQGQGATAVQGAAPTVVPALAAGEGPGAVSGAAAPTPSTTQASSGSVHASPVARPQEGGALLEVRAPMLGRFFRSPSPTEPPYVDIGSSVEPDDTVCIIEVMKLFNTVKAGVCGTIVEVAVENGAMVEHDTVLFRVRPE